jgi:NAD(P)H-hydrate repair Nnr-like enzyme with NAD(P)H-hydrate dehydratase domain
MPVKDDGGKDERGTVLVIAGSERTAGAVLLAGTAALRAGAGRLQAGTIALAVPSFSAVPASTHLPSH